MAHCTTTLQFTVKSKHVAKPSSKIFTPISVPIESRVMSYECSNFAEMRSVLITICICRTDSFHLYLCIGVLSYYGFIHCRFCRALASCVCQGCIALCQHAPKRSKCMHAICSILNDRIVSELVSEQRTCKQKG